MEKIVLILVKTQFMEKVRDIKYERPTCSLAAALARPNRRHTKLIWKYDESLRVSIGSARNSGGTAPSLLSAAPTNSSKFEVSLVARLPKMTKILLILQYF